MLPKLSKNPEPPGPITGGGGGGEEVPPIEEIAVLGTVSRGVVVFESVSEVDDGRDDRPDARVVRGVANCWSDPRPALEHDVLCVGVFGRVVSVGVFIRSINPIGPPIFDASLLYRFSAEDDDMDAALACS